VEAGTGRFSGRPTPATIGPRRIGSIADRKAYRRYLPQALPKRTVHPIPYRHPDKKTSRMAFFCGARISYGKN
jgi:hypothetical protein